MKRHSQHPSVCGGSAQSTERRGFVTLASILIACVIGGAIAIPLLLLSTDQARALHVRLLSVQARSLADACAELALQKLSDEKSYVGNETITLGTGTCSVQPITDNGKSGKLVRTVGMAGDSIRRLSIIVSATKPSVAVSSWQEVSDF